jgi:hypothetical protein
MGWKSTITITRSEAIRLIIEKIANFDNISNDELEIQLYNLGFGDDDNLPYYGYNFSIVDKIDE